MFILASDVVGVASRKAGIFFMLPIFFQLLSSLQNLM